MHCETRFVLTFVTGDVRECRKIGTTYQHVLNPAFVISETDERIVKIKCAGNVIVCNERWG